MKVRTILISLCCVGFFPLFAQEENKIVVDTVEISHGFHDVSNGDTLILENETVLVETEPVETHVETPPAQPEIKPFEPIVLDSRKFSYNPLFLDLIFMGVNIQLDWREYGKNPFFEGKQPRTLNQPFDPIEVQHPMEMLTQLRNDARDHITRTAPGLYRTTLDQLADIDWMHQTPMIESLPMEQLLLEESTFAPVVTTDRILIQRRPVSYWQNRANALLQFSQTSFSENWHLSGNNFFALLGVMSARFHYDNRNGVRWENDWEWRTGFNTVEGDSLRRATPNDDLMRIISNFNVRATGNFSYNASMQFQTHFFNNPRAINSYEMRARFLTPIRFDVGLGMSYRRNNLEVTFSPISFRYVYLTLADTTANGFFINPNTFGVPTGENELKEFGSRLVVRLLDYRPIRELTLRSTFNFFTNYEQVEIDWEIIAELTINRFFSTRLMLNPRFDNTVIFEGDERARIQWRQMLTVGFSYRFL